MLRQYLKGMLVGVLLLPAAASATLIKDNALIFDTASGLYWVPVDIQGALAPEDLPLGQRYASADEVDDLFGRYVRVFQPVCNMWQGPCDPTAYQAIVSFLELFDAAPRPGGPRIDAVYGVAPLGIQYSQSVHLGANDGVIFLNTESLTRPPIVGELGMFLISAVPEPSSLILFSIGLALLLGRGALKTTPRVKSGEQTP